jgi:hypothetical protein
MKVRITIDIKLETRFAQAGMIVFNLHQLRVKLENRFAVIFDNFFRIVLLLFLFSYQFEDSQFPPNKLVDSILGIQTFNKDSLEYGALYDFFGEQIFLNQI